MNKKIKIMKYLKYIVLSVFSMTVSSCGEDFLSPKPISSITADTFYSSEKELETAVINMYDGIQGINSTSNDDNHGVQEEYILTEMRTDNSGTRSGEGEPARLESYSVESTNSTVANYYSSFYNIIFRAHVVLENLGVADSQRDRFEGEAKFVRAYAYFNLVRLFGEVPMPTSVVLQDNEGVLFTRIGTSTIYDLIVDDLTTAVANLDNTYKTRASQAAAQALLAKVHLTLGEYNEALPLLEPVISSMEFDLEENFEDIYEISNERNEEIIFAIGYDGVNQTDSQLFSAEMTANGRTSGLNYLPQNMISALENIGGEERAAASYQEDPKPQYAGFFQTKKFIPNGNPEASDPTIGGNDWIVLRYADVLLMHVEAIMAGNPSTSDGGAIASFQKVRDRAGLTDLVTTITAQELLDERRVELAFENHRFFDLIRFGVAETVLGDWADDQGYNFSVTDLLLPIPQREINLSKGQLDQNPGY